MRYEGRLYRPPSEAHSYILQATIGCSWNKCTYCDMYRDKEFRVRDLPETLEDLELARREYGSDLEKVFVADGDALVMSMEEWRPILEKIRHLFPSIRQVSCYAMATNINAKSATELRELRDLGLDLLYIGPESGDEQVMRRIAKGSTFADHVVAARAVHDAGMKLSTIFLLGAGGIERSEEHALASARLATAMDPEFLAALTLTVVPGTPIAKLADSGRFEVPDPMALLTELRTFVASSRPTRSLFRTNHASNYLPLGGTLPHDRDAILDVIDRAVAGDIPLRPDHYRGL
jgi:radical SAM superfamily enzyme YgiQ (UPF0313 family)